MDTITSLKDRSWTLKTRFFHQYSWVGVFLAVFLYPTTCLLSFVLYNFSHWASRGDYNTAKKSSINRCHEKDTWDSIERLSMNGDQLHSKVRSNWIPWSYTSCWESVTCTVHLSFVVIVGGLLHCTMSSIIQLVLVFHMLYPPS